MMMDKTLNGICRDKLETGYVLSNDIDPGAQKAKDTADLYSAAGQSPHLQESGLLTVTEQDARGLYDSVEAAVESHHSLYTEYLQCKNRDYVPVISQKKSSGSTSHTAHFTHLSCESMISLHTDPAFAVKTHLDPDPEVKSWDCFGKWFPQREGSEAWWLLVRVILFNILVGINFSCFGLLYVEYTEHFQARKADVGWIISLQSAVVMLLGIFVSWPMERWGSARVSFVGSLISALGLVLSSVSPSVAVLCITQGFITGIGFCISSLAPIVIIMQHFTYNRSLANGMSMIGFSIGNIVGPRLTTFLLGLYGWRGTLLILAGIMANRAPISLTFWSPTKALPQKLKKVKKEGQVKRRGCRVRIKNLVDFTLFRHKTFLLFCLASLLHRFHVIAYIYHLPSFVVEKGFSLDTAAFIASLIFICNTVFRFICSLVSNFRFVNLCLLYTLGVVLGTAGVIILIVIPGYKGILISTIVTGFHLGLTHTIISVILVDLLGVELIGRSLALFNFVIGIVTLTSTPLTGLIYDASGDYNLPFIVTGCAMGVSVLLFALLTLIQWRQSGPQVPSPGEIGLQEEDKCVSEAQEA